MIRYEFPLNERIRTLLRLEDLFSRIEIFLDRNEQADHHVALLVLFEILEVACRADLKSELIQELERQKRQLAALHNNPEISEDALEKVLSNLEQIGGDLLAMEGKIGQHLRDNEWLMSIKQRAGIPGGVCEFDLPSYHHWQHQPSEVRRQSLEEWLAPLLPIRDGLNLVLRLLRESGKTQSFVAPKGSFQKMQGGRVAQMLRISLADNLPYLPEISANKYALNIRFLAATYAAKSSTWEEDVPFNLTFCYF